MLVATFGPTTTWAGKTVNYAEGAFVLEGHGPIRAQDLFEYERQGHLVWAMDGVRAWVGAKAQAEGGLAATPLQTAAWQAGQTATTGSPEGPAAGAQETDAPEAEVLQEAVQLEASVSVPPVASGPPADPVRERALSSALAVGFSRAEFEAEEQALAGGDGEGTPPGDVFLSLADRAIGEGRSAHDWPRLGAVYSLKAWWLDESGRDSLTALRRARRAELYALDAKGVERVRIAAADDDACPVCGGNAGREMSVADALRRMAIPNPSCSHGWCRCRWALADEIATP